MATRKTNRDSFGSDATSTVLGFEYQKLIALEYCLDAKSGDIIYIECFGDVSTTNTIVETKNHLARYVMNNQSPDFWKTLKNFVQESSKISQYSKLILHTTATVKDDSIFADWNSISCQDKLKRIEEVKTTASNSIRQYVDKVFSFCESYREGDLLNILDKLEIRHSQPNVLEKYEQLKRHRALSLVEEKYTGDLLCLLHGYIGKKAIDNHKQWKIIYDDFLNDLRSFAKRFMSDKLPFPEISPDQVITGDEKFRFLDELEKVALKDKIEDAVIEYLRTAKSKRKLIAWGGPVIVTAINNFEDELFQGMVNRRELCRLSLPEFPYSEHEVVRESQRLFYECRKIEKLGIRGVQEIEIYYQYGSMHKIVEDGKFAWMLARGDI